MQIRPISDHLISVGLGLTGTEDNDPSKNFMNPEDMKVREVREE